MKTTLKEILSHKPCGQEAESNIGWDLLTKTLGTKDLSIEVDLIYILKSNGIKDAIWALCTQNYLDYCLFLADIADITLPVFEAYRPDDSRVRNCIQAIRDFKSGKITADELASAAKSAKAAARSAARSAGWSARAFSASRAAMSASWATMSAAGDAGDALNAAWAAVSADATWIKIEELFVKYFGGMV